MGFLNPLPELPGSHAFLSAEEAGKCGDFGKMELIGDLGDAHRGLTQQERGFHQEHLVDVVDDGTAARHLADDAREVGGGDAEMGGVESDVVMFHEMLGQQTEESEEDFFDALGESVLADAVLLDGGEVGEEEIVEHPQALGSVRQSRLLILNHHVHQFLQALLVSFLQGEHGRGEFYHGEVGCADGVANRGQTEREMLVAQHTDAAVVAGGRENGDLEARRIGVEVALVQRQFAVII